MVDILAVVQTADLIVVVARRCMRPGLSLQTFVAAFVAIVASVVAVALLPFGCMLIDFPRMPTVPSASPFAPT